MFRLWSISAVCLAVLLAIGNSRAPADEAPWKAGTAREKITPAQPFWMSGYGPRRASEALHDLWVKVLALEAADGERALLVTADVCGFSRQSCEAICAALEEQCGLTRHQVRITCSHTHTGPALRECLHVCWPWHDDLARREVERYSLDVEARIVAAARRALDRLEPARLEATEGTADFAVNRRNNKEADVPALRERGEPLRGPVDHSVPMLLVKSPAGALRVVVFGYACHATTIAIEQWSGDYPGFAMLELERRHPGIEAMFFQGCGADQNPLPRGTVDRCREYGLRLAESVDRALPGPTRPLAARLRTRFATVDLPFKTPLTADELRGASADRSSRGALARYWRDELEAGRPWSTRHPYAIQAWKLGADQLWISLSGEVVVDYALKYRQAFGPHTWVQGYAHDLVCYIPSTRILREGGGQEPGVPWDYGIPFREWADDLETRIDAAVEALVQDLP